MQRFVLPLAITLALALALPAQAASGAVRSYAGAVQPSGNVAFNLQVKKGKKKNGKRKVVRKVKKFTFVGVPITCAEGQATTSGRITFSITLTKKRRFDVSAGNEAGSNVRVQGRIKRRGPNARGTLRVFGNSPRDGESESGTECSTGVLDWHAVRQPAG